MCRLKVTVELRPMDQSVDEIAAREQVLAAIREKFPALRPRVVKVKDA